MSINNKKNELLKMALTKISDTEKEENLNKTNTDRENSEYENLNNILNIKLKEKNNISKKNYLDESTNSENLLPPKKGINRDIIKNYENKCESLRSKIDALKKELKLVKRDKLEIEEELSNVKYEKIKAERKFDLELNNIKEINSSLEEQNNKLIMEKENMKRQLNEYSPQIAEYKDLYEKYKRLEKENKQLSENYNFINEQFNENKKRTLEAEKNYQNLKLENRILVQNNDNLKKNLNESEIKINNQNEKIAELEKDMRDMNNRNQNYIEKLTEKNLSLDNSYKDKVAKELNEMRNRYENDIFMLKKQYDDLSEKKTSYLKEERDEYRSKYNQSEAMLKEKDESLNIAQNQLRDLTTKTNAEISQLKLQLNIKMEELNSKSIIYEEQASSLALYKSDNDALKEQNDLLKREIIKLDADYKTKLTQYEIELRTAKEKLKLYEEVENKLDNVINLAPDEGEMELVEIIKDTPSSNKRRISQNLTLASKVKMLSEENEKLRVINEKMDKDIYELNDQCKIYKNVIDNVKQPNSYLITNLKDREIEIYRLKQELLNKDEEIIKLKKECESHIETINKIQSDMQKMIDNRKKIDDLQNMLTNFIQKEKNGKNNINDIDNMNNYVNSFNNNLTATNFSINQFSTQQGFYHTASSGFRQQKPERDIEVEKSNKKVTIPEWYKVLKKKNKKY